MNDLFDPKSLPIADEENPYLARIRNGEPASDVLGDAIAALKRQAHANGLTDEIVDAELAAWYAERED